MATQDKKPEEKKPEEKKPEEKVTTGDETLIDQMNGINDDPADDDDSVADELIADETAAMKEENERLKQQIANTVTDPVEVFTSAIEKINEKKKPTEEEELESLMFSDTAGFIKKMDDRADERAKKRNDVRDSQKDYWENFYEENKDLAQDKDLVDMVTSRELPILEKLSAEEGGKEVAKKVRAIKSNMAKRMGVKEEMPNTNTQVLNPSSEGGKQPETETKVLTLAEQLNNFQSERK